MRSFLNNENLDEGGAISLIFIAGLWLLLLLTAGTLQIIRISQEQIATQSRLDICAVRLAVERKNLLAKLVQSNRMLQLSRQAIYALRGVQLLGPVGKAFGGLSETALKQIHLGIATYQESAIKIHSLLEAKNLLCPTNKYSSRPAFCHVQPNLVYAHYRQATLFPDLKGNSSIRSSFLGRIKCQAGANFSTQIALNGDTFLNKNNINETYEK